MLRRREVRCERWDVEGVVGGRWLAVVVCVEFEAEAREEICE